MDPTGVVLGLMAAVFWGSYLVPVKTVRISEGNFTIAMGVGLGVVVLAVSPWLIDLSKEPREMALSMLAGVIWSFGNVCSLYVVRGLGFSRAIPLFAIATVINAFYGILLFGELVSDPVRIGILFLGMALLIAGIVLALSTYESKKKAATGLILLALACGFFFGTYNAPIRATTVPPPNATAGLFLGMIITCIFLGLILRSWERGRADVEQKVFGKREFLSAMISGVIWGVGTTWSIYAISKIGLALSFPIFQLNILVYIIWGLFYFKEIAKDKYWRVLAGTAVIIVGAVLIVAL